MDIKELKKLIKESNSVLLMEDGQPSAVIMSYDVYRGIVGQKEEEVEIKHEVSSQHANGHTLHQFRHIMGPVPGPRESEILDKLNKEIMILKEQIEIEERKAQSLTEGE